LEDPFRAYPPCRGSWLDPQNIDTHVADRNATARFRAGCRHGVTRCGDNHDIHERHPWHASRHNQGSLNVVLRRIQGSFGFS
jgi:Zn-finger nucleic acid-binding protein